jgi:hypothetical protein
MRRIARSAAPAIDPGPTRQIYQRHLANWTMDYLTWRRGWRWELDRVDADRGFVGDLHEAEAEAHAYALAAEAR